MENQIKEIETTVKYVYHIFVNKDLTMSSNQVTSSGTRTNRIP